MKAIKYLLIGALMIVFSNATMAQTNSGDSAHKIESDSERIYDIVEQMPSFPGGNQALYQYISSHIKYPAILAEAGTQGRVIVTFVVEPDGSLTNVKVSKSVDAALDKEALRLVSSMPRWIPGKQNGKAIRVKYSVPVSFRLK